MRIFERKLTREKSGYDMPMKTPLKHSGKNIRRNDMTYTGTCVYIVSLKKLYEKPLGKTHDGKKSTIYAILGLLIGYSFGKLLPLNSANLENV